MDTPQSVTNMKISESVMPLKTTQPRGLIQNKRDDDDSVQVILYESEKGDNPNLDCHDDDTDSAVAPLREFCAGNDNQIFDSVWHDKTDGWKKFSAYAGDSDETCLQVITSTNQDECLAGSSSGMSITGGIVYGEEDMDGTDDNQGPGKRGQEVDKDKERGYKIHRASLYTFRYKDGTFYHVRMKSELGEEYRKLATRDDKKAFILANGFPKGNLYEARARGKAQKEKKRLEGESTGETLKRD